MAQAQAPLEGAAEPIWFERFLELSRSATAALGLAITASVLATYVAMEAFYGHLGPHEGTPFWARWDTHDAIVLALLLGYIFVAKIYGVRGAMRDITDLRPLLRCSDAQFDDFLFGTFGSDFIRGARIAGTGGVLVGAALQGLVAISSGGLASWDTWNHHFVWFLIVTLALFWMLGRLAYLTVECARPFRALDMFSVELDLLDLRPLVPYVRIGLRNALLWIVGISLGLLLFSGAAIPYITEARIGVLLLATLVAVVALMLPLRGVRRRVRAEKQSELDRVQAAIRGDRTALGESRLGPQASDLSLADLVAYKGLIESVREWPIPRYAMSRFLLYLVIPVGSWIGGALVERFLGALLD